MSEQTVVRFGNDYPQMQVPVFGTDPLTGKPVVTDTISVPAEHINQSVTTIFMEPDFDHPDQVAHALSTDNDRQLRLIAGVVPHNYAIGVQQLEQIAGVHAGGVKPAWVDSSDADFAQALGSYFNCPVGEPTALLTNGGRDALHAQHLTPSAQPAGFTYLALSASTATELATNTTLPGEITTAGGGLVRSSATAAHTAGTNTSTLTKTFTANGSDALPVTPAKVGVLNASSSGTLGYEKLLSGTAPLSVSGDNLTVTWTDTVG